MLSLWTVSKLSKLRPALLRKLVFYAPLIDFLDFKGIDPVTFARASTSTAVRRDGLTHNVAANVPRFEYTGELPLGVKISSGETLQFAAANNLNDANTLIWFEDGDPKSTPTNPNPFNASGVWTGNLDVHVKHVCKSSSVLSNGEINQIQAALEDVVQSIPTPEPPPAGGSGVFVTETPAGTRNGVNTVFTLSQDPNLNSLLITAHGGLYLRRVSSSPDNLQFTAGGTGNRTITMGLAPDANNDLTANYVIA